MSDRNFIARFLGGLLMIIGGLVAGLAGACTAIFAGGSLIDLVNGHGWGLSGDLTGFAALTAGFGLLPIAFGVIVFLFGRWLWRRPRG